MYPKWKFHLILLLILSSGFTVVTVLKTTSEYPPDESGVLIGTLAVAIVFFFLPRGLKLRHAIFTYAAFILLGINLGVNSYVQFRQFRISNRNKTFAYYESLSCNEIEAAFSKDSASANLKYFRIGNYATPKQSKQFDDLNIEVYFRGDMLSGCLETYNEKIEEYVMKKHHLKLPK
ncbi:MAG: hypothetical protein EOO50_14760 [Flavobacterium sp.]|uniref:hypothetical protein n=1 Tax=Flavobacterium sp. TaxID=239 RepID=UPI001200AC92|nr:hypothetical protein [Flavobacterium sp.]RZJ65169.1 MAG: hypothetical protein EOO50_14760 [Flavobacterium sp.]